MCYFLTIGKVQKIDQNALPNYKINDQYEPDKDPGCHQPIILDSRF